MIVIDPASVVNGLVRQQRAWETQQVEDVRDARRLVTRLNKIERAIKDLADAFDLHPDAAGDYYRNRP